MAGLFAVLCAVLLVGCGGKAASGDSGHGWLFILTFCALAWIGFLVVKDGGMTTGKFLTWLVMAFVLWKGMNWTVEGGGWLLHRIGNAKEWIAGAAKPEANKLQPAATPARVAAENQRPSSSEPENPLSADTLQPFGESRDGLGTRLPRTAENKSGDDFGSPHRQGEVQSLKPQPASPKSADAVGRSDFGKPTPPPAPVQPPGYKAAGGVTMTLLQDARDPLPSQRQELELLEKRMSEIEVSLLAGLKKATAGKQPVEDLKHMVEELKMVTSVLKLPEECQFKKSVEALRQQLDKKSSEFDDKIKKGQTGKDVYMEMFTEIKQMKIRTDALCTRFGALKSNADALIQEAAGWIDLYQDTASFKGEAAAREGLENQLQEKEKSLEQEQEPKNPNQVAPSPKTRNKNK